MVLVDTSVWIDFLGGKRTSEAEALSGLLKEEVSLVFTGILLQELLQGCSVEREASQIETYFEPFIEITPQRSSYRLAAKLYRDCRKKGYAIRSSVDCLVAACAIENECRILHRDRDYTHIGKVSDLQIFSL